VPVGLGEMRTCSNDLLRGWRTAWLWLVAFGTVAAGWLVLPPRAGALVAAGGFTVAGALCFANALHCHRTHCLITGPLYCLAALLFVARAVGAAVPGGMIIVASIVGTILAFVPEWFGMRYIATGDGERPGCR